MILSRTNINFGNVSYLQQKEETFTISTTTPITVTNILSDNSNFVIVNQTFPVLISTSLILTVRFTSNIFVDLITGTLTISSNQPTVTINNFNNKEYP